MSRKDHENQSRNPDRQPGPASKRPWVMGLLLLTVGAGLAGVTCWLRGEMHSTPPRGKAAAAQRLSEPAPTAGPAIDKGSAIAVKPDLLKLRGRWRRSGEQYVLEVRAIDGRGNVDAAYFNPQPIRVSRAMASQKDGAAALFVELRDTGYPGCTYTLIYDPQNDLLVGVYYQASMQESYEIVFERMK